VRDVLLIGAGGHASVILHMLRARGARVIGHVSPSCGTNRVDLPWLGTDDDLAALAERSLAAVMGLGKTGSENARSRLLDALQRLGYDLPVIVAPHAVVHEGVELGVTTVVMDGAVVVTGSVLGRGCIVNHNATVDHDCRLGDDVHVAPGATLSGGVRIGNRCLVGVGSSITPGISVCDDCVIGAGATVIRDIAEPGTYVGTPARRVR